MNRSSTVSPVNRNAPLVFKGSALARWLLARFGWSVHFQGLPALQGVLAVYPHTSNWDFVVMILAKWSIGVQVQFWGKDRLFAIPLFGRWLRWLGGIPVRRGLPSGAVGQAVALFQAHREQGSFFWLGVSPEGTRAASPGLRSGFYRTALAAGVPLGLIRLDYARREVTVRDFLDLTGDEATDMRRISAVFAGARGLRPDNTAPVRLLDKASSQAHTIEP